MVQDFINLGPHEDHEGPLYLPLLCGMSGGGRGPWWSIVPTMAVRDKRGWSRTMMVHCTYHGCAG